MEKVKLSNFIKQIRGVSYKPEDIRNESDKNAIPILRANNITADEHIDLNDIVYVDSKKVQNEQLLRSGDIFICASSGSKNLVGKAVYIPTDMPYAFGAFCKVVRPISENLDKHYLAQFFQSPSYRKKISDLAQGANINNIKNEHIAELDIAIYSLEEQKAIAERLDKVSGLIEKRKTQLEKLDLLIKSRFIELFDGKYKTVKLGDVVKTTSGGTPSKAHPEYYENGNIPWLTSGEVNAGVITSVKNHITDLGMKNSSAKMVPANSVVIAMYGATAGVTGLIRLDTTTNQAVCSILPSERFVPEYLYYAVSSKKDWMISQCQGGGQPNISQGIIKNMDVIDAPIEEQIRFAAFVEQVEKSKFEIQKSLEKLEILKKSLMQQYFG